MFAIEAIAGLLYPFAYLMDSDSVESKSMWWYANEWLVWVGKPT